MIYQIDFSIKDQEKYKQEGPKVPKYVVANGFDDMLAKAKSYETDNLTLYDARVVHNDGLVVISDGVNNEV
jgi:hypothetical protein